MFFENFFGEETTPVTMDIWVGDRITQTQQIPGYEIMIMQVFEDGARQVAKYSGPAKIEMIRKEPVWDQEKQSMVNREYKMEFMNNKYLSWKGENKK